MTNDPLKSLPASRNQSAEKVFAITPDDTADLSVIPTFIAANTSGLVAIQGHDGVVASVYLAAGVPFPIRPKRIMATGTDAAEIRGFV